MKISNDIIGNGTRNLPTCSAVPQPTVPPRATHTLGTGSFPGVKRPERGVNHPPHLAPMLKKDYSYTSTPPLGFRGLF
jgi:hypothetical protein